MNSGGSWNLNPMGNFKLGFPTSKSKIVIINVSACDLSTWNFLSKFSDIAGYIFRRAGYESRFHSEGDEDTQASPVGQRRGRGKASYTTSGQSKSSCWKIWQIVKCKWVKVKVFLNCHERKIFVWIFQRQFLTCLLMPIGPNSSLMWMCLPRRKLKRSKFTLFFL